jgi:hypothetical protein
MSLLRLRRALRPLVPMTAGLAFGSAATAQTYTVAITPSTPNLGSVASATSGDTVFTVAPSTGAVSRASGTGVRVSTATTRATVTVTCSAVNSCDTTNVAVRIGTVGTPTNRARALTNFTVAPGTATISTAATGTNPINLQLGPIPRAASRTFHVGANFPIAADNSGLATGVASSGFYVYAIKSGSTPTAGSTAGLAVATVYRPISMALTSNLAFGTIVRPKTGSGIVDIDEATGARTFTAGAGLNTPAPSRAAYSVTGEGGQIFSVAVPASFVMDRTGGGSLTVTTSTTATATQALGAALGSAGTYSFGVGGTIPVTSTTALGSYSGTFSVTVQYN